MPEQSQDQQEPIELPPLDPNRLLARVQSYNPDLYGRIIAEEQRDQLAEMVQALSKQPGPKATPKIAQDNTHEVLDLDSTEDAA